jgi:hypothetical protein
MQMSCPAIKQVNRKKSEGKTSRFFGVRWHRGKKKWRAEMRQAGKQVHLADCKEEIDAATIYVLRASMYYGQPVREKDIIRGSDSKSP